MKKPTISILLPITLLLLCNSCTKNKFPCVDANGTITNEYRTISGFTGVYNELDANIYITQDTAYQFRIEAPANIFPEIKTKISNGIIEVYSEHCLNSENNVKIYIAMPEINSLEVSGSGSIITLNKIISDLIAIDISGSGKVIAQDSIIANTIELYNSGSGEMQILAAANYLETEISGSGEVILAGKGTDMKLEIYGSGEIHAFEYLAKYCTLDISGSGNMYLNVTDKIEGDVSGSGDIYYMNTPSFNIVITGSGELIHVD